MRSEWLEFFGALYHVTVRGMRVRIFICATNSGIYRIIVYDSTCSKYIWRYVMPQIHCYIPDDVASQLGRKAEQSHLSVSKYLARLVKKDITSSWPDGYFEQVFGQWEGEPLHRPEQGEYENRDGLQ